MIAWAQGKRLSYVGNATYGAFHKLVEYLRAINTHVVRLKWFPSLHMETFQDACTSDAWNDGTTTVERNDTKLSRGDRERDTTN